MRTVSAARILGLCALFFAFGCNQGEVVLTRRSPQRLLLMAFQEAHTSSYPIIPSFVRSDSIWLYNEQLTVLGNQRYRAWVEYEWYIVPPGDFFTNPARDRTLFEVDCRRDLMREGKRQGEIPDPADPWVAPPPGTIRQAYLDSLCVRLAATP